jgi:hypothetical protein
MRTAEQALATGGGGAAAGAWRARRWAWPGLALVLGGGLALRLWGVQQGLPYVYNTDENDHFVPHAVQMFEQGTLNPHYFANPPAYTYLLHFLFALWYGSGHAVVHAYFNDPQAVYTLARVACALLGTASLWLLYLVGSRLFGRAVGLLAAAIEAVAFLPVFYAHLALNDVPTLAPLTLSLLGTAGVLRNGRRREHLLAGIGLGLACASKYTAGIVVVPYLVAVLSRYLEVRARATAAQPEGSSRRAGPLGGAGVQALVGLIVAGVAALVAFFVANPYALLDYSSFHAELAHQSALSAEAQGKLGAPKEGGLLYYLWSLTWGLGWVPALAALGGAVAVWRVQRRLGWLLVPAPLLFLAFMGAEGRYFGRWLMPILPILCLLGACFAAQLVALSARAVRSRGLPGRSWRTGSDGEAAGSEGEVAGGKGDAGGRRRALPVAVAALAVLALLAQGLIYSVHNGLVLARKDTRTLTREWMVANIPPGSHVVVEPVAPDQWAREPVARAASEHCGRYKGYRWCKWPSEYSYITSSGALDPAGKHKVGVEDYERTLSPALIPYYESKRFCWVLTGSTESGRAQADPASVPNAIAYYQALRRQGRVVFEASPYARGKGPVAFDFDWSFDYYPLAYERPGPSIVVYRLQGGRCRS